MRPGSEQEVGFIVHAGDTKSSGGKTITINTKEQKEVWLVENFDTPLLRREDALTKLAGSLSTQCAHWCAPRITAHLSLLPRLTSSPSRHVSHPQAW